MKKIVKLPPILPIVARPVSHRLARHLDILRNAIAAQEERQARLDAVERPAPLASDWMQRVYLDGFLFATKGRNGS